MCVMTRACRCAERAQRVQSPHNFPSAAQTLLRPRHTRSSPSIPLSDRTLTVAVVPRSASAAAVQVEEVLVSEAARVQAALNIATEPKLLRAVEAALLTERAGVVSLRAPCVCCRGIYRRSVCMCITPLRALNVMGPSV